MDDFPIRPLGPEDGFVFPAPSGDLVSPFMGMVPDILAGMTASDLHLDEIGDGIVRSLTMAGAHVLGIEIHRIGITGDGLTMWWVIVAVERIES